MDVIGHDDEVGQLIPFAVDFLQAVADNPR